MHICIPQYRGGFLRLLGAGGMLGFDSCVWGDDEVVQLVAALEFARDAGAATAADGLFLPYNRLTDAAAPPLVAALEAGAMPELTDLALEFNEVGDAGLAALRPLLAGRLSSRLRRLGIGGHPRCPEMPRREQAWQPIALRRRHLWSRPSLGYSGEEGEGEGFSWPYLGPTLERMILAWSRIFRFRVEP
ncbi:hypothetical protein EMIHUDRAFT_250117 [Emiliania huxleyi CCMP1516]|uniref:Uncharacterized protein n=2 Tax=Emiliania huxleyi TaxID=2903 RepID=A0A0D3I3N6_EMIH1|nr:hypothetical protein EMIHUDRAFT_250117 [Emiliania huxleyi CCMP1516]EOD05871.1 hypothetical protein EMIHUDRAFT_250117 [Emiliania huxleyi CCMP1516]|eukprot:XP_005758300.1 hypothetical protein EMIHUDRAFT_250117 [Emiliania huxleyi CCMP1516]